jgi:hypothetical protein
LEIHQNNIFFYFLNFIFDITTSKRSKIIKKKYEFRVKKNQKLLNHFLEKHQMRTMKTSFVEQGR